MTPAQRRIAAARQLDDARNRVAFGAARTACLAAAAARLTAAPTGPHDANTQAAAVRPYLTRHAS